jgi:hypothetical protein
MTRDGRKEDTMIPLSKFASRSFARTVVVSVALGIPVAAGLAATAFADVTPEASTAAEIGRAAHQGSRVNVTGDVARYFVGPLGHVRGFLLKDGTAVMVHGTAGDAMAKDVAVGQPVRVEGFSPTASGGREIVHAAVFGQHGQVVTPPTRNGEERDPATRQEHWSEIKEQIAKLPEASANGTVQAVVTGHRGKPIALVLTDGTSVFLRPRLAKEVMTRGVRVGDRIQSSGNGATYPLGASVLVRSISFADGAHFEVQPAANVQPR